MSAKPPNSHKRSVEHQTLASFVGAAIILLMVAASAFVTAHDLIESTKQVQQSLQTLAAFDRLRAEFSALVSSERAYVGTGDADYLADHRKAQIGVHQQLQALRERIPEPERHRELDALSSGIDQHAALMDAAGRPASTPGTNSTALEALPADPEFWNRTRPLARRIHDDIAAAKAHEQSLYESYLRSARTAASRLYLLVALVAVSLVLALGSLLWRITCDLRERRAVENHLQQANHFLESLLENIPATIFAKDAQDLRYVRFNRSGEQLLGRSREDLMDKTDWDVFPPDQAQSIIKTDREVLAQGNAISIPAEEIDTPAGRRIVHTYKVPVRDEHGQLKLLLGISMDITEQKTAERRAVALNQELLHQAHLLQASNAELESFCYSVSHDLRAPLRAINGYARRLQEEYGPRFDAEGTRFLRTICSACDRMSRLIDDLLEFSRIGRQGLGNELVNMDSVVKRVVGEVLGGRPPPLPDIEVGELPAIRGDRDMLHLAWLNLIDNAVKYTSAVPSPHISIRAEAADDEIVYSVSDNGIGFDMQYADKLFGVFQRLHSHAQYPGTGVGLAIAHRIIARHGGRIWASSEPGRGATFSFALPRSGARHEDVKEM